LYQEWKEKNTKNAYVSETTQNDEEEVNGILKPDCTWLAAKTHSLEKPLSFDPAGR